MNNKYYRWAFTCILLLLLPILAFSKKIATLPDLMKPSSIQIQDNRMYFMDDYSIKIYSMFGFKQIKSFLRKGLGPAEVQIQPISFFVNPKFLVVNAFQKILYYSPSGEYISEKKKQEDDLRFCLAGNNYVLSKFMFADKNATQIQVVALLDKNFKLIRVIYKSAVEGGGIYNSAHPQKKDIEQIPNCEDFLVYKDRIYVADTSKGLFISVFDSNGNKLYDINTSYEKHKVTAQYKEKRLEELKKYPGWGRYNPVFKDYFPAFESFRIADDRIFVRSLNRGNNDCDMTVMDLKGKILKKTKIPPVGPYTIDKNKFYYLIDNDDEQVWELHCIDL